MTDNQIVMAIIPDTEHTPNATAGERYIVDDGKKCVIFEYTGTAWKELQQSMYPTYVFVTQQMKTIILFNKKIWSQRKWFICSLCGKITLNKMKSKIGATEVCIHCFFKANHDNPNKSEYDGKPITIGKYIQKFGKSHRICAEPTRCFLCDFKNGKLLLDIKDRNLVFTKKLVELLHTDSENIDIVI